MPSGKRLSDPSMLNSPTVASASVNVPSVEESARAMTRITMRDPMPTVTTPETAPRPAAQARDLSARETFGGAATRGLS